MDLDLTAEQRSFRDEVRAFIQHRLPSEIRERLRAGHPPRKQDTVTWQRILNERGWAAPHWPKAYGGADLGQMERLILMDEMFRAPAPLPQMFNVVMLGPVLLKFGTPEQLNHFMPQLANLDVWFCQGFSEPGSGSDLASLRTSARREGESYIVNGQKIWTTTAHVADWVFALVRTSNEARKGVNGGFYIRHAGHGGLAQTVQDMVSLSQLSIESVMEARTEITCVAIRLACARATEEDFGLLQREIDLHTNLFRLGQGSSNTRSVIEFYRLIAQATHNPLIVMMVDALSEVYRGLLARVDPRPNKEIMAVRQRVLDLMRERDAHAAAEAMTLYQRKITRYLVSERDKKPRRGQASR